MTNRKNSKPISIETLIKNGMLYQHYQPIINLNNGQLLGHESLMRCKLQLNPETMIRLAMQQNKLLELDTAGISRSIYSYFDSKMDHHVTKLFVNIFPNTLLQSSFGLFLDELIEQQLIPPSSIVFELNELKDQDEVWNVALLKENVSLLRKKGFKVAIDDVGEGAASLKKIIEFRPDFIKLARYFATDLANAERKQRIAKLFVSYCDEDTQLILEGLETSEDLACAKSLGINYGQGYILGRPKELASNE